MRLMGFGRRRTARGVLLSAALLLAAVHGAVAQSVALVMTFQPPGTTVDIRFPLPDGVCPVNDSTPEDRALLFSDQKDPASVVVNFFPCRGLGYGLPGRDDAAGEREGVIIWSGAVDPVPSSLAHLLAQAIGNNLAGRIGPPSRADVDRWDAEWLARAMEQANGTLMPFAAAPADEQGNYRIDVGKQADGRVYLASLSTLALQRHFFTVLEVYLDVDRTGLTAAEIVADRQRWARLLQAANR